MTSGTGVFPAQCTCADDYALKSIMRQAKSFTFDVDATTSILKIKQTSGIDPANATPIEDMAIKLARERKRSAPPATTLSRHRASATTRTTRTAAGAPSRGGAARARAAPRLCRLQPNARGGASDSADSDDARCATRRSRRWPSCVSLSARRCRQTTSSRMSRCASSTSPRRCARAAAVSRNLAMQQRSSASDARGAYCRRVLDLPQLGKLSTWISHMAKHHPDVKALCSAEPDSANPQPAGLASLEDPDDWPTAARGRRAAAAASWSPPVHGGGDARRVHAHARRRDARERARAPVRRRDLQGQRGGQQRRR